MLHTAPAISHSSSLAKTHQFSFRSLYLLLGIFTSSLFLFLLSLHGSNFLLHIQQLPLVLPLCLCLLLLPSLPQLPQL